MDEIQLLQVRNKSVRTSVIFSQRNFFVHCMEDLIVEKLKHFLKFCLGE